ncbi:MAG: TetR/AcrR family transcriptional regulator [Anaerovoracaceae bacterium]
MEKRDKHKTNRQRQAEKSKQKIFNSAQYLFAKYGYDNITIADICKRAGVSTGLFYNYFGAKSEILMFSDDILSKYYESHRDEIESLPDALDRFVELILLGVKIVTESPSQIQNARVHYMRACQGIKPSIFDESRTIIQLMKNTLAEGRKAGQIVCDTLTDDEIVTVMFNHMVGTVIHLLNVEDKEAALVQIRKEINFMCSILKP